MSEIRRNLGEAMKSEGVSQRKLAARTGVERGTISRFLNGKCGVNTNTVERLAEGLQRRVVFVPKEDGKA